MTAVRRFSTAVARVEGNGPGAAAIGIALDDSAGDRRLVVSLRHADGTELAAQLTDDGAGRLASLLKEVASAPAPGLARAPRPVLGVRFGQ